MPNSFSKLLAKRRASRRKIAPQLLKKNPLLTGAVRPDGNIVVQPDTQLLSQSRPSNEDIARIRKQLKADNFFMSQMLGAR